MFFLGGVCLFAICFLAYRPPATSSSVWSEVSEDDLLYILESKVVRLERVAGMLVSDPDCWPPPSGTIANPIDAQVAKSHQKAMLKYEQLFCDVLGARCELLVGSGWISLTMSRHRFGMWRSDLGIAYTPQGALPAGQSVRRLSDFERRGAGVSRAFRWTRFQGWYLWYAEYSY